MNDRKRRIISITIIVLVLFGFTFGYHAADRLARKSVDTKAEVVLMDSAREQAVTLATAINGQYEVLRSVSELLNRLPELDADALNAWLAEVAQSTSLSVLRLIGPDGTFISATETENFSDREYFQKAMQGESAMQFLTSRLLDRKVLVLSQPRVRDGEIVGVISGLFFRQQLRELITSQMDSDNGFACILNSAGDIIVEVHAQQTFADAANVEELLESVTFRGDATLDRFRSCLQNGQSLTMRFSYEGVNRVAALFPLVNEKMPENDWFVLNVVDSNELVTEIIDSRKNSMIVMGVFAFFGTLALLLFLYLERDYKRQILRDADELQRREQQFRIVAMQCGRFVSRYDIATDTLYPDSDPGDPLGGGEPYSSVAEHDIFMGKVAEESAEEYTAFFKRIADGESPVQGDFLLKQADGRQRWYRYMSTTLFDRPGKPAIAVISYFDYTELRERELAYLKWQREISSMSYENAFLYEWNLTWDNCEGVRGSLPPGCQSMPTASFDQWTTAFAGSNVTDEDSAAYIAFMDRERLVGMFNNGVDHASLDYRAPEENGEQRWRRVSVQMAPYPDTRAVKAYVVNTDINDEKQAEMELITRSERDGLTGALNREALISQLDEIITQAPSSVHAVMMLDVDAFKQINDQLGHEVGDQALIELVHQARSALRSNDCIGRLGGDEFMIFLPNMPMEEAVDKKAELLCSLLRQSLGNDVVMSVSMGVALYPRDGKSFAELYRNADAALYHIKHNGRNGYVFYHDNMKLSSPGD